MCDIKPLLTFHGWNREDIKEQLILAYLKQQMTNLENRSKPKGKVNGLSKIQQTKIIFVLFINCFLEN